jgi:hypothetical protein
MLPSISNPSCAVYESHVLEDEEGYFVRKFIIDRFLEIEFSFDIIHLTDTFWLGDYVVYDSQTFIIRQFMRKGIVYLSVALIADQTISEIYLVRVKITSRLDKVREGILI